MANQELSNNCQVLWKPQDIQQFLGKTKCCIADYTNDLSTLDLGSNWVHITEDVTCSATKARSSIDDVKNSQENSDSEFDGEISNQTDGQLFLTTLGLLLLATITFQNNSYVLKESINKLISDCLNEKHFQDVTLRYPHLKKKLSMSSLQSFVNFCIGHCRLCKSGQGIVKDAGILQVWCDVVEPIKTLVEILVMDHIHDSEKWNLPLPLPTNVSSLRTNLKQQKAAIYARFHVYDFSHDARYQSGAQQIMKRLQTEGAGCDLHQQDLELEAKLFYFTRFFEKVNKEGYHLWLSQQEVTQTSARSKIFVQGTNAEDSISQTDTSSPSVPSSSDIKMGQSEEQVPSKDTPSGAGEKDTLLTPVAPEASISLLSTASSSAQTLPSDHLSSIKTLPLENSDSSAFRCQEGASGVLDATTSTTSHLKIGAPDLASSHIPDGSLEASQIRDQSSDREHVTSDPAPVNSDPPPYPASFLEILKLVQSGQEIPGIEVLDIKPTEAALTESKLKPVQKPWLK